MDRWDGLVVNKGALQLSGGSQQLILPANNRRMFFTFTTRLPSLYQIHLGLPDFPPAVPNITVPQSYVLFTGGNSTSGESCSYDQFGPIMQQGIYGSSTIGALVRYTEVCINQPFISYLPKKLACLPIAFRVLRRFTQDANPVNFQVFSSNRSRFAIGVGTSSTYRLAFGTSGNSDVWFIKGNTANWDFLNSSILGSVTERDVVLRYDPSANQENTIFELTMPGVAF